MEGQLHQVRSSQLCSNVVIFTSKITHDSYRSYLDERDYDNFRVGEKESDLTTVFKVLSEEYGAKTILTDTGKILGNLLLNGDYVDTISLLVHPILVEKGDYRMFDGIKDDIRIELSQFEVLERNYPWLIYKTRNN